MAIIEELQEAFSIITKPRQSTKKSRTIEESIGFYYRVTIIPAIIVIIVGIIGIAISRFTIFNLIGSLLGLWVAAPIGFFIGAAWLHLFGKFLLKTFKNKYDSTLIGVVYGYMPQTIFVWISAIISIIIFTSVAHSTMSSLPSLFGSAMLSLAYSIIIGIWGFIITLFALANQQRTTKLNVFVTGLVAAIIPIAILAVLIVVPFIISYALVH